MNCLLNISFVIIFLANQSYAILCIGCTSDGGNNPHCEGEFSFTTAPADKYVIANCSAVMTHCYVQYIDEKTTGGMARWNRNCCNMNNENDSSCRGVEHDLVEGIYEKWTKRCKTDICNTVNPDGGSGGEGESGGVITAEGKNNAGFVSGYPLAMVGSLLISWMFGI